MFTRRVFAGCAIGVLAASGVAQEHEHGKGEKLGAVALRTSCNAEGRRNSIERWRCLHSFQFNHAIQVFNAGAPKVIDLRNRTLGNHPQPVEQSVRGWHEGQQPATGGTRKAPNGAKPLPKMEAANERTSRPSPVCTATSRARHAKRVCYAPIEMRGSSFDVGIFRRSRGADFLWR